MLEQIIITIATAATPLLIAALGELVVERSGVLNLGVEGMMVMGAVTGFAVALTTGSPVARRARGDPRRGAVLAAVRLPDADARHQPGGDGPCADAARARPLRHDRRELRRPAGRIKLSAQLYIGSIFGLTVTLPFVGKLLFGQDPIFYLSILLTFGVAWFLFRTRAGLTLRSVGDNHGSAHALGINVIGIRYLAVMFGGACAGLAGGFLSLVYTPQWIENMTAGRGWIALALVVFASWRPLRVLAGAYLFGAVSIGQLHAQALGIGIPSQLLSSLPYLATVIVLVLISRNRRLTMINTPASLGRPFVPDR